ncbi:MAG: hypothetical protein KBI26_09860, partial [Thermoanaerobaculia bacterium]|nr:hypothetical protein [Thermoanaerobaculia bacterium]
MAAEPLSPDLAAEMPATRGGLAALVARVRSEGAALWNLDRDGSAAVLKGRAYRARRQRIRLLRHAVQGLFLAL